MQLKSRSFADSAPIPSEFAFASIHPATHITLSTNRNPHLTWTDVPDGTNSFVLICHDYDVPSRADDVNQEGREVPASLPRIDFFHWVLIDIPATATVIEAGSHSNRVTPRGKPGPAAPYGLRHGINDYTSWFANDPDMRGDYYGYDGPCPPWNDSVIHHYVFTLHAIDVPRLELLSVINGPSVRAALAGHVLAKAVLTGTYSLNPRLQTS
ncbi:MAG TPA: YbhB/YbcL family Raf kinase inhibitor-like protein [Steroidobacteraceae bacterium]|nr:YbhB/YbcL family Raf kinase inhibitor-like protein [Steroidobacteraceae bacterium]